MTTRLLVIKAFTAFAPYFLAVVVTRLLRRVS